MDLNYILNHLGEERGDYFNAISPPVIQSSNFQMRNLEDMRQRFADELALPVYTRGNNPTVNILRKKLAALESAEDCLVFSSGAAAIAASILHQVKSGDHVVCIHQAYSWTNTLLQQWLPRYGVSASFVDGKGLEALEAAILPNSRVLYLESPSTGMLELQDLRACAALARKHGLVSIIDNSYCSPLHQQPIALGIDLVVHSGTKYLNGHSDVVLGVLCGSAAMIKSIFQQEYMTMGAILGPHDAALVIRGLRTLPLRLKKSQDNALFLTEKLLAHPKVERVSNPWHASHPQYELATQQMTGGGGLFTVWFKAPDQNAMENFIHRIQRFLIAVSWGGHESLMIPYIGFYKVPGKSDSTAPWNVVRFYAGLEEADWLWEDLEQALEVL
jgi:cystathionine beta-lyase/cystathionine gamma-synthase